MTQQLEKVITRLKDLARLPEREQDRIAARLKAELDKITAKTPSQGKRIAGLGEGTFEIPDDFDEPLPDEFWLGDE